MLERIILVDDSEGEALFVKRMLRDAGLEDPIFHIQDPEEALRYFGGEGVYSSRERFPIPDIVLLDLGMPKVDGYAILSWIRSRPEMGRVAVIVLTGEVDPKKVKMAYQLGATSFLAKSATMEEFRHFVTFFRGFARLNRLKGPHGAMEGDGPDFVPRAAD
jgi:CheY-like chemotaxis protein